MSKAMPQGVKITKIVLPDGTEQILSLQPLLPQEVSAPRPKPIVIRCGCRTRAGTPCALPVVIDRTACRLHGGLSTGPTTEAGRAAIAESNRRRSKNKA